MNVKVNSARPRPTVTLEHPPGEPVDLTSVLSIRFRMKDIVTGTLKVNTTANIVVDGDPRNGSVHYVWQAGDNDAVATYEEEWWVTQPDGEVWKFPSHGKLYIHVEAST